MVVASFRREKVVEKVEEAERQEEEVVVEKVKEAK